MPTWTPGPWNVQQTPKGYYVRRPNGTLGDAAICKVLKVPGKGRLLEREQEAEANARILAASVDMLDACELFTAAARECVALLNSKGYACPSSIAFAAERARLAIEKATGVYPDAA